MTRYSVQAGWAWLEALDGRRQERVAWAANVETGEILTFENTSWLVWVLLAEEPSDATSLTQRAAAQGAGDALARFDIPGFLHTLESHGLIRPVAD